MAFLNRDEELETLEERWRRGRPEFFVLWGRRRVGKTELLSQFLRTKRGLLFEATEGQEPDHLADLSSLLAEVTGSQLLAAQPLTSWPAVLAAIESFGSEGHAVVVLDEFQWIARATGDIGSELNRWWRERGRRLPIFLILSGSEVSFFQRQVLSGTMYGRRTGQLNLLPFGYREAALFFPGYTAEDKIRAYAVCGGMPYYLEQLDPQLPLAENILRAILHRDGVLREEARLLLYEELPDPARYFSILRAIQAGATRFNEIVQRTKLEPDFVDSALKLMRSLQLVRRVHPVTVANPERTRQTYYEIMDGYLRFYFRFVLPYESRLPTKEGAERHLRETILPGLDHFVSRPAFEEIARDHVKRSENASDAGSWWGHIRIGRRSEVREVDVVAIEADRTVSAIGCCKWTSDALGVVEDTRLQALAAHIPGAGASVRRYFFSRSGFTPQLEALARAAPDQIRLVLPEDLF